MLVFKYSFERNDKMIDTIPGEMYAIEAKDVVKDKHTQLFDVQMPDDYQKTGRLVKTLKIKIGARVMMTNNVDVTDGLTNGAMGMVTNIIKNQSIFQAILVKFDNKNVGVSARMRSTYKHICKDQNKYKCICTLPCKWVQTSSS